MGKETPGGRSKLKSFCRRIGLIVVAGWVRTVSGELQPKQRDETFSSEREVISMSKITSTSLRTLVRALLGVGALLAAPCGFGQRTYDATWDGLYPASLSDSNAACALCHTSTTSGTYLNAYGSAIHSAPGSSLAARIAAVEAVNSDRDLSGASNLAEIQANTQPGWTGTAVAGVSGDLDPVGSLPDDPPPEVALPNVNVSPSSLTFGGVDVGATSTLTTTISNLGGSAS